LYNLFSPPPSASIATKIGKFSKGRGKRWGVWCKGVQCLVMGELKHIKILSLKFLIIASLPFE
jgi:hypothetical protein